MYTNALLLPYLPHKTFSEPLEMLNSRPILPHTNTLSNMPNDSGSKVDIGEANAGNSGSKILTLCNN